MIEPDLVSDDESSFFWPLLAFDLGDWDDSWRRMLKQTGSAVIGVTDLDELEATKDASKHVMWVDQLPDAEQISARVLDWRVNRSAYGLSATRVARALTERDDWCRIPDTLIRVHWHASLLSAGVGGTGPGRLSATFGVSKRGVQLSIDALGCAPGSSDLTDGASWRPIFEPVLNVLLPSDPTKRRELLERENGRSSTLFESRRLVGRPLKLITSDNSHPTVRVMQLPMECKDDVLGIFQGFVDAIGAPVERVNASVSELRGAPGWDEVIRLTEGLGFDDVFGIEGHWRPPLQGDETEISAGRTQIEPVALWVHDNVERMYNPNLWILRISRSGQPARGIVVTLLPEPEHVEALVSRVFQVKAARVRFSEFL